MSSPLPWIRALTTHPRHLPSLLRRGCTSKTYSRANQERFNYYVEEEFLFRTTQERAKSTSTASKASSSTHNAAEVGKFRSASWWDPEGQCKPLHSMNALRVSLVRDALARHEGPRPLESLRILDVGCGGGILSEPLARLGATVTGLDAAQENVKVAEEHAKMDPQVEKNVKYVCSTIEDFAVANKDRFDAVVASEVIEHVDNQLLFVQTCASLLKKNGSFFVTTLNRNRRSYLAGVVAAECILGLLPVGTHDWEKFVRPEELDEMLATSGCQTRLVHGMFYWSLFNQWTWIPQTTVNYAVHAVKVKDD